LNKEYTYNAFISYRHTDHDKAIADKLQRLLEAYTPPTSIVARRGFKKFRVFRDEAELPTSNNLSEDIKTALENSRFLIVLCSKTTRESRWCMEEIRYFKELHNGKTDNIITVLTEGEPSEVFPIELREETRIITDADGSEHTEIVEIEPLAANVVAPTIKESLKKLKLEYLRIVAPILEVGFDTLYNRNQRRFIRRMTIISTSIVVFLLAFGIYTGAMLLTISEQNRDLLEQQETISDQNIDLLERQQTISEQNEDLLIRESRYLSQESARLLAVDDRIGAIETALAALPSEENDRPWISQAEFALSEALYAYQTSWVRTDRRLAHSSPVEDFFISYDGTRIISRDNLHNLHIWDAHTGEIVRIFSARAEFNGFINGFALTETNQLFVVSGRSIISIDTVNAEILWEREHSSFHELYVSAMLYMHASEILIEMYTDAITLGGYFVYNFGDVVISNDGSTVAVISINTVVFLCSINGDILFSHRLLDEDDAFTEQLVNNGTFSKDDKMFYVSSESPLLLLLQDDSENRNIKYFRICLETWEVIVDELDLSSSIIGIYSDEDVEIVAVSNYEGNRDVLLAFSRESGEKIWENPFNTSVDHNTNVFIYRRDSSVLVVLNNIALLIDVDNGEIKHSTQLQGDFVHGLMLAEFPYRAIIISDNGYHISLATGAERYDDQFFQYAWLPNVDGNFRNDVHAARSSISQGQDMLDIRYAFVAENARNYIVTASFTIDDSGNYLTLSVENYVSDIIMNTSGDLLAFVETISNDVVIHIVDPYRWVSLVRYRLEDTRSHFRGIAFDAQDNIVICTTIWMSVIDWRNDSTELFSFAVYEVVGGEQLYSWSSAMGEEYTLFSNGREHYFVNIASQSYRNLPIIDYLPGLDVVNTFAFNSISGNIAFIPGKFMFLENELWTITYHNSRPHLVDGDFAHRGELNPHLYWSNDGSLLVAVNARDEVIVFDAEILETVARFQINSPAGITFSNDNKYLFILGNNGVLYEYSLEYTEVTRQLRVYDSEALTYLTVGNIMDMFDVISINGRYNIIVTAGNFASSYIIDIEQFSLRAAIPDFATFNELQQIIVQHGLRSVRVRQFYSTDELIKMAHLLLNRE